MTAPFRHPMLSPSARPPTRIAQRYSYRGGGGVHRRITGRLRRYCLVHMASRPRCTHRADGLANLLLPRGLSPLLFQHNCSEGREQRPERSSQPGGGTAGAQKSHLPEHSPCQRSGVSRRHPGEYSAGLPKRSRFRLAEVQGRGRSSFGRGGAVDRDEDATISGMAEFVSGLPYEGAAVQCASGASLQNVA